MTDDAAPTVFVTLTADASQLVAAARRCVSAIVFTAHPDLGALDDELNNLYPEARDDR